MEQFQTNVEGYAGFLGSIIEKLHLKRFVTKIERIISVEITHILIAVNSKSSENQEQATTGN